MRVTKALYDAAVAEVRGTASEDEIQMLESDVAVWAETLRTVLDEVDGQVKLRKDTCDAEMDSYPSDARDIHKDFLKWKSKSDVFRKHVWVRLRHVERLEDNELPPNVRRLIEELMHYDEIDDNDAFEDALSALFGLVD